MIRKQSWNAGNAVMKQLHPAAASATAPNCTHKQPVWQAAGVVPEYIISSLPESFRYAIHIQGPFLSLAVFTFFMFFNIILFFWTAASETVSITGEPEMNTVRRVPKTTESSFHCSNSCESTSFTHVQYQHEELTSKIKTLKTLSKPASQKTSQTNETQTYVTATLPNKAL